MKTLEVGPNVNMMRRTCVTQERRTTRVT